MTFLPLLPKLVAQLQAVDAVGSVQASNSLEHALAADHDQYPSPRIMAFLSALHAEKTAPMLSAYSSQLHWTFGVLLTLQTQAHYGQDQWNILESLSYNIIQQLEGIILDDPLTPLRFIDSHDATDKNAILADTPNSLGSSPAQLRSLMRFRTSHRHIINTR